MASLADDKSYSSIIGEWEGRQGQCQVHSKIGPTIWSLLFEHLDSTRLTCSVIQWEAEQVCAMIKELQPPAAYNNVSANCGH